MQASAWDLPYSKLTVATPAINPHRRKVRLDVLASVRNQSATLKHICASLRTQVGAAAALTSSPDLPSPGSTVERAAYLTSPTDRAAAMKNSDRTAAVEASAVEAQMASTTASGSWFRTCRAWPG